MVQLGRGNLHAEYHLILRRLQSCVSGIFTFGLTKWDRTSFSFGQIIISAED